MRIHRGCAQSMALRLATVTFSFVSLVTAQGFAVPSNWRKPTSDLTRQERLAVVDGILNTITRTLNPDTGIFNGLDSFQISESASMLSALSTGDFINGSTTNKDVVLNSLNTMFTKIPNITSFANPIKENRDPATWGLAAIDAYRAYKDPSTLRYAQSMWTQLTAFLVRPEDAAAGTHPARNVSIAKTCHGASTAGAVFSSSVNESNLDVAGVAVTTFMALSAHLYEETSNSSYLSAATLSAEFIKNQLYNGVIIQDGIDLGTCANGQGLWTYDSGLTLNGVSALAAANSSYAPFLSNLISTVIPYPGWTNSTNGIITEGPSESDAPNGSDFTYTLKGIFVRGLYEAYRRVPSNSSEAGLIRSYLTVQYNALLDLASTPGSNVYSPRWQGPPIPNLNPTGQLTAIDVLNSAVGIIDDASADSSSATSSGATSQPSSSSTATTSDNDTATTGHRGISPGAIGGIVVGVVILVFLVLAAIFIVLRRRRRGNDNAPLAPNETLADPYLHVKPLEDGSAPSSVQTLPRLGPSQRRSEKGRGPGTTVTSTESNSLSPTSPAQTSGPERAASPQTDLSSDASGAISSTTGATGEQQQQQVTVNLASFERLVQRLDTVIMSGLPSQRGHAQQGQEDEEQPPRYEA